MTELSVFAAVAGMILCALVKGYTTKAFAQLRQEAGRLQGEETRARQELDQVEILRESAEALNNQAELDCEKFQEELDDLTKQIKIVQADLGGAEEEKAAGERWAYGVVPDSPQSQPKRRKDRQGQH